MKNIKKDELFQSLNDFLTAKGVELKDGTYARRINQACDLLTDAINATQQGVRDAKVKVDGKLNELRQTIHEATAPTPPPRRPAPKKPAPGKPGKGSARSKAKPSPRRK